MPVKECRILQKGLNAAANKLDLLSSDLVVQDVFKFSEPSEILGTVVLPVGVDVVNYMLV